ncbi:nucleotidyltransferase domain-containing protein [Flavobacterium ichthyis]|uniref:nucleotidyltransferase domain-containing protein n=1 Tax=Flavobacterium ichthyis TaxID=2698827 RepID=UPI003742512F
MRGSILKFGWDKTISISFCYIRFGSSTTDKFDEHASDIDLLVEGNTPDAIKRGENLLIL